MHSTLRLESPLERAYYTIANQKASLKKWEDHIYYMGGDTPLQVTKMWSETAGNPIATVSMSLLRPCLYDPVWTTDDTLGGYLITPMQILDNIDAYPAHKSRILQADMSFLPIVFNGVFKDRIIKHRIIDGNHRVAFAEMNHQGSIQVKYISESQLERCIVR